MCWEDLLLSMTLPYPILDIISQYELFESYLYKFMIGGKHYSVELLLIVPTYQPAVNLYFSFNRLLIWSHFILRSKAHY